MDCCGDYLIVSGRWDNTVAVIDVAAALLPENDRTDRAVISRLRVTADIDADGDGIADTRASGQPIVVCADPIRKRAYVVNHSGEATPEAATRFQHGHAGSVAVIDLEAALQPKHDGTLGAIIGFIPTDSAGPVGAVLTLDRRTLLVASGEAHGSEDGGELITIIDATRLAVSGQTKLARNDRHSAHAPSSHPSPHPSFGRWPNPTGIALSPLAGGVLLVANGGFADVSFHNLEAVIAGQPNHEIGRVAVETGPFGIAVSPDGRLAAVAAREDMSRDYHGRTISLIDIAAAVSGRQDAEVVRVHVGSDFPSEPSRPFAVAFSPDGRHVVATCFRSNSVSVVDVGAACIGRCAEVARLEPRLPGGIAARPRGICFITDSLVAVIGGEKSGPRSSAVFLIDIHAVQVVATVTGVGNESYFLDKFRS